MSFVAIAIGGAAVVGGAVGLYSSAQASASAANAQAQNAANVSNTNQLNYQQFLQSRGSTGSAILPIYAQGAEQQLYQNTLNAYNQAGALQPTAAQLQAIQQNALNQQGLANNAAAGVFNGNLQNQLLANQQPVYQAQLQAAATQKQGTLEALQGTLNNIKAIQAGKGYAGDSFGNQMLNFQARQGANTQIANTLSQVNVGNAQAVQGIKSGVLGTQLSNLNLPGQMAANTAGLSSLAGNTLAQNQAQRSQLFNTFAIGNKGFQYQNLPQVNPIASTGQIAGQAVGSLASAGGNYAANQSLINQLNSGGTNNGGIPNGASFANNNSLTQEGENPGDYGTLPAADYSAAANNASFEGALD